VLRQTDLFVPDSMPLALTRTYKGWDYETRARDFGLGTNHPYNICPTGTRFPYTYQDLNLEDARQIHFSRISKGTSYADAVFRYDETSSEFYGAQDAWNGDGWTLSFPDGRRLLFPEAYKAKTFYQGAPYEMQDGSGHLIQLKRDEQRRLKELISPSGRTITFKYDSSDRIIEAADDGGQIRSYSYDSTDHLQSVSDGSHVLYRFEYAKHVPVVGYDPYLMTAVIDGRGKVLLQNI
jgi:YD repeat-containing protein